MLLCIPGEIRTILEEFGESVFAQRPTLLPESVPLVLVGASGAAAAGSATLVLDGASTLRVSSIALLGGRSCLHVVALEDGDDTASHPTPPILARLVAPRCALSLARPAALGSRFACVECAAAPPSSDAGEAAAEDDVVAAATSLRAWCVQAAEAIATGKRFAPVLRRPWAWAPPSGGVAVASMHVQFRPGGAAGSAPIAVDAVVPLGSGCSAAVACRTAGLRSDGLPFDWVLSSLESNVELIEALLRPSEASTTGIPFDGSQPAIPLCHITNTNNYVSARAAAAAENAQSVVAWSDSTKSPPTHVFDARYGIVASNTEAARFPRRAARLRDVLSAARTVVCVYIGRPHRDAESLTVDGRTVHDHTSADSGERVVAAANRLFRCVRELHRRRDDADVGEEAPAASPCAVSLLFFAFNCALHDFTHVAIESSSQMLLVHKFVGFADPSASWDSIGHVVGRLLPDPASMRVRESCQHLQ